MTLIQLEPGKLLCETCGRVIKTKSAPDKFRHMCSVARPQEAPRYRRGTLVVGPAPASATAEPRLDVKEAFAEIEQRLSSLGMPSLGERMSHYAGALLRWRRAGYPVRTDEETEANARICFACEDFNKEEGACRLCGCFVSLKGWAVHNKARMGTEHCSKRNPSERRW